MGRKESKQSTSSIFLSKTNANLDWTPRKNPQNKDPIQPTPKPYGSNNKQWINNNNRITTLEETLTKATDEGAGA